MTTKLEFTRQVAHQFIQQDWKVLPIKNMEKFPRIKEWQKLNITAGEVDEYFYGDLVISI
ncbi:MAG: hypothetical protein ACR2PH_02200 [Desulfobulbia bacterium]